MTATEAQAIHRNAGPHSFAIMRRRASRPVQKHKRTQGWRAGPFRSSSTCGEPQFWGVSEAMSAIRVPRISSSSTHSSERYSFSATVQARPSNYWSTTARVKPDNILLDEANLAFVSDWGLARPLTVATPIAREPLSVGVRDTAHPALTGAGQILGTVSYASPEQLRGEADLDHRTDIYSLGCLM